MTTERLIRPSVAHVAPASLPSIARDVVGFTILAGLAAAVALAVPTTSFAFPVVLLAVLGAAVTVERRLRRD
ncbi:MAG: hypothetical protein MUC84_05170 [Solirubrobacteraceae bacterium]|jgi:hypothetical protein|nr:hypothetical protein [Solirubrobacteraceae bacterium]